MTTPLLARFCRRCGNVWPPHHFKKNRKTCKTCLEGAPPPEDNYIVVPRPREVRRWWPEHVLAHKPAKPARGPCPVCGKAFKRKCLHQRFCSLECRRNHVRNHHKD